MDFWLLAGIVVAALFVIVAIWIRVASTRDREVFRQMEPLMEDLWNPMRFLADLRSVWPDLSETQRREIESSSVYRDQFHEKRAVDYVKQLRKLARNLRSTTNWPLRRSIRLFLSDWEAREPDSLKVLLAMVRKQTHA